jgi:hypothetical protein
MTSQNMPLFWETCHFLVSQATWTSDFLLSTLDATRCQLLLLDYALASIEGI